MVSSNDTVLDLKMKVSEFFNLVYSLLRVHSVRESIIMSFAAKNYQILKYNTVGIRVRLLLFVV